MSPKPITENTLFYGDNLPILREYVADESVDLGDVQASAQGRPGGGSAEGVGVVGCRRRRRWGPKC